MNYLKTFLPYLFGNKKGKSYVLPKDLNFSSLSFEEKLMFHTLGHSLSQFISTLDLNSLSSQQVYHLFSFHEFLPIEFFVELKNRFSSEWNNFVDAIGSEPLSSESLQELLYFPNGRLSVFALLHKDRSRPGKLLIRKANGDFLLDKDGHLWSIPVLGLSGRGLSFNHSNGNTPQGIFTIDSVMPEADKTYDFGLFRRLVVNFIPTSPDESELKKNLPLAHYEESWWKPCLVGRELGRSLLRIHGTGRKNPNIFTPYFPLVPTSGCLATSEVNFFGLYQIQHQKHLLSALLRALGLTETFENESKIHGLLYVVEFDGRFQALEFRH